MLNQAVLVLQLLLVHNVQKAPGIEFVSPLHQVELSFTTSFSPLFLLICLRLLLLHLHVTLHQFGDTALPCTDDSDCITLGWKYGCFLYRWVATI